MPLMDAAGHSDDRDNLATARNVVERLNNRLDELEAKGLKDSKQSRMYYRLLRYYTNRVHRLERDLSISAHEPVPPD